MTVDLDRPIGRPQRVEPERVRCDICGVTLQREAAIATESARVLAYLCGSACHAAWRRAAPITDRLACQGEELARWD
jgi:hypothetical protein